MSILDLYLITPCTVECVDGVGMGLHADVEVWHHKDCPNHTTSCCSPSDDDDEIISVDVPR